MRNVSVESVEKIKTHILYLITSFENRTVYKVMQNNMLEPDKSQMQYDAYALLPGYLRLWTHTQKMKYLLLFHCNSCCTKAPRCYVIRTLPVLLWKYSKTKFSFWLIKLHGDEARWSHLHSYYSLNSQTFRNLCIAWCMNSGDGVKLEMLLRLIAWRGPVV